MRISVGLPVYDRKVDFEVMRCLLTETAIAQSLGIKLTVRFLSSCTNLAMGRNQIVQDFLDSGDDKLVFLDSDVTFEQGSLVKLAGYPVDLVAGAYRLKQQDEDYPVAYLEDRAELWADKNGLIEVKMVPTGFLALSRDAFAKFREGFPGRDYENGTSRTFCYFQIPYRDGALYTEDAYFCREWREIGGKVYLAPEMDLTHWNGNIPHKGHIGNWLKGRDNGATQ